MRIKFYDRLDGTVMEDPKKKEQKPKKFNAINRYGYGLGSAWLMIVYLT